MVGTPKNMVFVAAASTTACSSKRSRIVAEAPAARVPNSPAHRPWTWKSGRARIRRSSGCHSQAATTVRTPASRVAWVWTAPLGFAGRARGVDDEHVVGGLGSRGSRPAAACVRPWPRPRSPPPSRRSGRRPRWARTRTRQRPARRRRRRARPRAPWRSGSAARSPPRRARCRGVPPPSQGWPWTATAPGRPADPVVLQHPGHGGRQVVELAGRDHAVGDRRAPGGRDPPTNWPSGAPARSRRRPAP